MPGQTVLVVEDEKAIADLVRMYLEQEGFSVAVARDGLTGLRLARQTRPAAIVLDVGLPGMTGTDVCASLRADGDWTPVLFCTARDEEADRIRGLDLGADDYITKPFSPRELVARVRAALRRGGGAPAGRVLLVGSVRLDEAAHTVEVEGEQVHLTSTEFDLLAYLMARPGVAIPRDQLLEQVWGYPASTGTRTVDVHVAQLRSKLGDRSPIRTVWGVGYAAQAGQ